MLSSCFEFLRVRPRKSDRWIVNDLVCRFYWKNSAWFISGCKLDMKPFSLNARLFGYASHSCFMTWCNITNYKFDFCFFDHILDCRQHTFCLSNSSVIILFSGRWCLVILFDLPLQEFCTPALTSALLYCRYSVGSWGKNHNVHFRWAYSTWRFFGT